MALPAGPTTHPALLTVRWTRNPFRVMDECRARFGDTFSLPLPFMRGGFVVVSDPADVKEVFALGPDEGHAGKANFVLKPFLGEHSLLLLDGAEHLRQRKMMLPAFHGERMHSYGRAMLDLSHESIDRWRIGTPFAVHRPMQQITLQVIVRTVFGIEEGPRFAELSEVLTRTLDAGAWPGLLFPIFQRDLGRYSPWGRFLRFQRRADEILRSEIRRGRERGDGRPERRAGHAPRRARRGRATADRGRGGR